MANETKNSSRPAPQRSAVAAREENIRGPQPQGAPVGRKPPAAAPVLEPHQYRDMRARKAAAGAAAKPQVQAAAAFTSPALDARAQARQERLARMRAMVPDQSVRVNPRDDGIRKLIRHPLRGRGFPSTGSVEWPLDTFTRRRIRDGDVTIVESKPAQPPQAPDESSEQPADQPHVQPYRSGATTEEKRQ